MAALGGQDALAGAVVGSGGLLLADGGRGLEADAEVDGRAVGDAALDATAVVCLGGQLGAGQAGPVGAGLEALGGLGGDEGVVVDGAGHLAAAEAGADLEALGGGDGEHGVGQQGLHLVEAGLAQPRGRVLDDAGHGAADAVVAVAELGDVVLHAARDGLVGAAHGQKLVDGLAVDVAQQAQVVGVGAGAGVLGGGGEEVDGADAGDEGDDLDAVGQAQVLLGDGAGGDAADGLAGAAPAAAGRGLDAVLLEVCPVGVRGPRVLVDGGVAVVLGALVLVEHAQANRGAEGDAELGARLDLDAVLLVSRRGDGRLAGAAACHLRLDVGFGQGHAGRAAVDDAADGAAVGFTIAGGKEAWSVWEKVRPRRGTYVVTLKCSPNVDMVRSVVRRPSSSVQRPSSGSRGIKEESCELWAFEIRIEENWVVLASEQGKVVYKVSRLEAARLTLRRRIDDSSLDQGKFPSTNQPARRQLQCPATRYRRSTTSQAHDQPTPSQGDRDQTHAMDLGPAAAA